jgi:hypothetical protein
MALISGFVFAVLASNAYCGDSLNVTAEIIEPTSLAQNISNGNIKLCLNEDDGDCDYPMNYAGQPNSLLQLTIPLAGSFFTGYFVDDFLFPGEGDAHIEGNDSGVWIKADYNGGQWAQLKNPIDGRTFADYVSLSHTLDPDTLEIGSILSWDIPRESAVFSVGSNSDIDQFKNRGDIPWQIRLRIRFSPVTDLDGNIDTVDDRIYWQTDEQFQPIFYETMLEVSTKDSGVAHSDWRAETYLPYLYVERKADVIPPTEPTEPAEPLSDEMVAVLSIITNLILF